MINLIAVIGKNRALGKNGKLLWRLPLDLKRFKKITFGFPVVMGRKTYDSIGKLLAGRINIIVTRNKKYQVKGAFIFNSLEKAIQFGKTKATQVFLIGGGEIYKQGIKFADKLYLTIVDDRPSADTFFPKYLAFKKVIYQSALKKENGITYQFLELTKI